MTTQEVKRKLTAILSADVKGYSRLMGEDEKGTVRTLNAYKEVMTGLIQNHHGRVVDALGDNVLAEFGSVVNAVECAVEIQKELKTRNAELPENRRMDFRIGVNLGDVIEEDERIYGDGVNIAARMESLSEAGGICISGTAYDQVENKLPLGYEYLGERTVKNIARPIRVYRVLIQPEAAGKVIGEKKVKRRERKKTALSLGVILIVIVTAVVAYFNLRPSAPRVEVASKEKMAFPLPDKPSIAVLPFTNMSGDPKEEYFCDGITDQIITTLSMIPRLFVIARNSTFVYKGKAVKVNKIAEEMGVRYVLEGSVQRSKDRMRILVQLIDAIKGVHLWSERYDRDLKDLFSLQDEIARQIMTALQVKLTEGEYASGIAGSTSNLKALECFWRAEEHFFHFAKEDNAAARQWAQKAVELDPKFAGAWALMGWTYTFEFGFGWSKSPLQSMERALESAQKAIGLDDSCAKANALMGHINLLNRRFDESIENGEKAVRINPNDPMMLSILATIMQFNGKFEESIALAKKSMRLSPYYPPHLLMPLSSSCFLAGHHEEALAASELMLDRANRGEFSPLLAHIALAKAYIGLGQNQKARAHAEEVLKINPNYSLDNSRKRNLYRDPAHLETEIDALRKAGLPEKPSASIPPSPEVAPKEKVTSPLPEKATKPAPPPIPKMEVASKEKMAFPLPDKPSIAVLPFTNMSGEKELEYFSEGLAEGIINGLAKSDRIFVIARNSTFTYKGKPVKVKQVAEEMGVRYVIEGSVQQERSRVRITVQLIDALTGRHLFSERYDRDLKNILNLQDEITMKVMTAVQVKLTTGEAARLHEKGTKNLDAYLKVLQAREYKAGTFNKERAERGRQLLEEAIALDPEYAWAYSLLSTYYADLVVLGASESPRESLQRAIELGEKAIALDDSNSSVHANITFPYIYLKEFDKAISEAEKAISLNPNLAVAYWALGTALSLSGRPQESIPMLQKSLRLSPIPIHSNVLSILANSYAMLGRYEEAIDTNKKVLQIYGPDHLMAHIGLATTYAVMGRENEARAEGAEILRIDPKFSWERWIKSLPWDQSRKDRLADALRKVGLM